MILLEQLYRLTQSDEQVRLLDPFFRTVEQLLAGVSLSARVVVDERHALLLTHVFGLITPGLGQNVITISDLRIQNPSNNTFVRLKGVANNLAANIATMLDWQGEIVVTPGCFITVVGSFNAGAVANLVSLDVYGMLIPLGNVERI